MTTTSCPPELRSRLSRYADDLRQRGAIRTDAVHTAFATVPRHRFLRTFHFRADQYTLTTNEEPPAELLDIIYANNSLVTHDGHSPSQPMSSSSGPSVMARMLEAADLRPGMRVLEIGAGTGYNAALIHTITGADVATVEAGDAAAAETGDAIAQLGLAEHIQVVHGDGYPGVPEHGPWDRIIVTCGIAGIPEDWLTQLKGDGRIIAPIAHAGVHPILTLEVAGTTLTGAIALWADFMPATGALRPPELFSHDPETDVTTRPIHRLNAAVPAVPADHYTDLTCFLAAHDKRTTRAYVDHHAFDPTAGMTALVEQGAAAWIQHTGDLVLAGQVEQTRVLEAKLRELTDAWTANGRPGLEQWRAVFGPTSASTSTLLRPTHWHFCFD